MYLVTWPIRAYLAWSVLALLYFVAVPSVLLSSFLRPLVPLADAAIAGGCVGLCLVVSGLVHARRAAKLASTTPLLLVLFGAVGLCALMGLPALLATSSTYWPDASRVEYTAKDVAKMEANQMEWYSQRSYSSNGYLVETYSDCSNRGIEYSAQYALEETYCAREGKSYCAAFPLRQTLVQPRIFDNKTDTSRIQALLNTSSTFFGVPIDDATTLLQFCDKVNSSVLAAERSINVACDGCRHAVATPDDTSSFGDWIHEHCPLTKVDATAAVCIMGASPKLYPFLLTYPQAKTCRRQYLSQMYQTSRLLLCYEAQFSGLLKQLLEALAYSALALSVLAFPVFWALVVAQCKRDEMDEDDELMYEAMTARPSTLG
ncbi:hypothetical protein SDRG_00228 [Saprolegnia diclina VS20]|uniref:Uncharacterized protein n=1 Tax=Saprolegnia diclina (strain VS20) TaxID=1156394 RepID=T0R7R8_SAPDV|nr:hypothetical protein SDRG_00228 [Saprolegnia diclina VS20]EQC42495.1 hypothetical protein SDRG_00228 [Saprolegnia diclina VS20]|eukprot:XP_008603918.1 hypothetical protein SDRG_00228 [Saprolegnia diclina VS20]